MRGAEPWKMLIENERPVGRELKYFEDNFGMDSCWKRS